MEDERFDLVNVKEAAKLLHVSIGSIRAWRSEKVIPAVKLGGKVLFRKQDLLDFVDRSVQPAGA